MSDGRNGQQTVIDDYLKVKKDASRPVKGSVATSTRKPRFVSPKTAVVPTATDDSTNAGDDQVSNDLNELRQFDLDPKFGTSIDSCRMDRWRRAESLGLNPPLHIKQLILDHKDDLAYTGSIWQQYPLLQ